jgi:hypothetical protein
MHTYQHTATRGSAHPESFAHTEAATVRAGFACLYVCSPLARLWEKGRIHYNLKPQPLPSLAPTFALARLKVARALSAWLQAAATAAAGRRLRNTPGRGLTAHAGGRTPAVIALIALKIHLQQSAETDQERTIQKARRRVCVRRGRYWR